MLCYIYRSTKRDNCYLYLAKQDDFASLPNDLKNLFGRPIFALSLILDENKEYVAGSGKQIKSDIKEKGFFLQMLKEEAFEQWINQ